MPVLFPEAIAHNNPNRPIVDTTARQVKGFGLFESKDDRDTLDPTVRANGFMAVTQENSKYKAFIFTGDSWDDSDDWTEIGSQPGGNKYAVLSKLSDIDFDYDWTETPQFESVSVTKYSASQSPSINLFRSRGSDHTAVETQPGDVIAEIGFSGVAIGGNQAPAGKMVFTQVDVSGYQGVSSKIEFFVGSDTGDLPAFTINEERVLSVHTHSDEPTPVAGGFYSDASGQLFIGIEN